MGRTKGSRNGTKSSGTNTGVGKIRPDTGQPNAGAEGQESAEILIAGSQVTNIVNEVTESVTLPIDNENKGAENWQQLKKMIDEIAAENTKRKQIVKITTEFEDAPEFYHGMHGGAQVVKGESNSIRWSNGEETNLH